MISRRRETNAAADVVLACLRADRPGDATALLRLVRAASSARVIALAQDHLVGGVLAEALRDVHEIDPDLRTALREQRSRASRQHLRGLWELSRLAPVLESTGSAWAAVKGPVIAETAYQGLGQRGYLDLDLLVEPARYRDVLEALLENGALLLDRNWRMLQRQLRGQLHLLSAAGTPIDLHWDLINESRGCMSIDTEAVLGRRTRARVGDSTVWTLDPTDALIHLAVHAAVSGGDRLIWLKDVQRSIASRPPDWHALVQRAHSWHVATPTGWILLRARRYLNADVPVPVLTELLGRRMVAVQFVDRLFSPVSEAGRRTPPRILMRAVGHGARGGASLLFRRVLNRLNRNHPLASSPFTPSGDERDREAFFAAVERGRWSRARCRS